MCILIDFCIPVCLTFVNKALHYGFTMSSRYNTYWDIMKIVGWFNYGQVQLN